jgi:chromosome segregation ATPase
VVLPASAHQEAVKAANRATRTAKLARIAAEEATRDAEIKRTEAEHAAASAKSTELLAKQQLSHVLKREERLSKDLGTVTEERGSCQSEIRSLEHTIDENNRKIEILQERANNLEYEALETPKLKSLILQKEDEKALTYKRLVGLEHQQHAVEQESKEWEAKAAERTRQMIQLQKERSEAVREITSIKTKVIPDLVKTGIMNHSQVEHLDMQ